MDANKKRKNISRRGTENAEKKARDYPHIMRVMQITEVLKIRISGWVRRTGLGGKRAGLGTARLYGVVLEVGWISGVEKFRALINIPHLKK